jgi:hypothetical protein
VFCRNNHSLGSVYGICARTLSVSESIAPRSGKDDGDGTTTAGTNRSPALRPSASFCTALVAVLNTAANLARARGSLWINRTDYSSCSGVSSVGLMPLVAGREQNFGTIVNDRTVGVTGLPIAPVLPCSARLRVQPLKRSRCSQCIEICFAGAQALRRRSILPHAVRCMRDRSGSLVCDPG